MATLNGEYVSRVWATIQRQVGTQTMWAVGAFPAPTYSKVESGIEYQVKLNGKRNTYLRIVYDEATDLYDVSLIKVKTIKGFPTRVESNIRTGVYAEDMRDIVWEVAK